MSIFSAFPFSPAVDEGKYNFACKDTRTNKNFHGKISIFHERARGASCSCSRALAHRKLDRTKYYRVIVFHRLVTKTTPRRRKSWFTPRVTSGEPSLRSKQLSRQNLWVVTETTEVSPFCKLKLHINKLLYYWDFWLIKLGNGGRREARRERKKRDFANTFSDVTQMDLISRMNCLVCAAAQRPHRPVPR